MDDARTALALTLGRIACAAGAVVLAAERGATLKADGSPVTDADKRSEHLIRGELAALDPALPIVAEESFDAAQGVAAPRRFALIDPLDGTREFVAGRDEFTVNIAIVEDGMPVAGAVYAPARRTLYLGGARAYRAAADPGAEIGPAALQAVATRAYPAEGLTALISRSHLDGESERLLARLRVAVRSPLGSSLKFCLIAEGAADLYPRLAPTMEWDTAAGQAVLVAAGGCVFGADGMPLRYGKPGFRNAGFAAWGRAPVAA